MYFNKQEEIIKKKKKSLEESLILRKSLKKPLAKSQKHDIIFINLKEKTKTRTR